MEIDKVIDELETQKIKLENATREDGIDRGSLIKQLEQQITQRRESTQES